MEPIEHTLGFNDGAHFVYGVEVVNNKMDKDYVNNEHIKLYKTPKDWSFGFEINARDESSTIDPIKTYIVTLVIYFGPFTLELSS